MKTVREDLAIPGTGQIGHDMLERAECLLWKKFDQMKRDGKLKIWGVIDASGVVDYFLCKVIGQRPEGCTG